MTRTLPALLAVVAIGAASTGQAFQTAKLDITGTWTGKIAIPKENAPPGEEGLHAVLSQSGTEITGSVGPTPERQFKIATGRIETTDSATTVTFETGKQGGRKVFSAKLVDGVLKGTLTEIDPKATFQFELRRSQ